MNVGGDGAGDGTSVTARFAITNKRGLHARASSKLVRLVETFEARVTVAKDGTRVGGTSIMGLMLLAAGPGSEVEITAQGSDARAALAAIGTLIADRFGEGE